MSMGRISQIGEENEWEFYAAPLLGYRTWRMDKSTFNLTGCIYESFAWPPPLDYVDAVADCKAGDPHTGLEIPDPDCACGFYGYWTYEYLQEKGGVMSALNTVRGAVMGWGRAVTAEFGWRAKQARPVALLWWEERRLVPHKQRWDKAEHGKDADMWNEVCVEVARKYGLPIVHTPAELEQAVMAYA